MINKIKFNSICLACFVLFCFVDVTSTHAQEEIVDNEDNQKNEEVAGVVDADILEQMVSVNPSVIDEDFQKSDIGKYSIKLKNHTDRKLDIYAMVNNISQVDGRLKFDTVSSKEKAISAANWILIRRGVIELMPYEEVSVPLEIRVATNAVPDRYYVSLSFPVGPNRAGAQNNMRSKSYAETRINIDVSENIVEKVRIKKFATTKNLYLNKIVDFDLSLENYGNRKIDPFGFIYIFNRNGAEVAKIEIAKGSHILGLDQFNEIKKTWSDNVGLGKYKARIELEYGSMGTRDLQDTLFFWVLPWKILLSFVALTVALLVILTVVIFKKTYYHKNL